QRSGSRELERQAIVGIQPSAVCVAARVRAVQHAVAEHARPVGDPDALEIVLDRGNPLIARPPEVYILRPRIAPAHETAVHPPTGACPKRVFPNTAPKAFPTVCRSPV